MTAPDPLVSVVIPAHQAAGFVAEAVRSALDQPLPVEVVVADDASADGTFAVLRDLAAADPRVVPLRLDRQSGPGGARNAAIAAARGRWLALLDADDLFLPGRLPRLVAAAEARGADLMADNLLMADFATGRPLGTRFAPHLLAGEAPVTLAEVVRRDMPDTPEGEKFGFLQPILRRAALERHGLHYAEGLRAGEDWLLYASAIAHGLRFMTVPEAMYVYRLRGGSVTASRANTLSQSAVNRAFRALAVRLGHAEVLPLLARRQRLLDADSFALLVERGEPWAALRHAHPGTPRRLAWHLRVAGGALRRRLGLGRGAPKPPAGEAVPEG